MIPISQQDINDLRTQGFSDSDINTALNELEKSELSNSYSATKSSYANDPRNLSKQSSFQGRPDENLIKFQLELNDILEKAEHVLRGDIPTFKNGQVIWLDNPKPEENTLNSKGIDEIKKELTMYINRNTILGDYKEDEIRMKVMDFGKRLNNLIFTRYEDFGMDTEEKRKHYQMIVGEIVDLVHSTYTRALDGGERISLREARQVSQSENLMTQGGMNMGMMQPRRKSLNPLTWFRNR